MIIISGSQELIVFQFSQFDCNVCGQTFCGSCSIKVKKAVLGVTCKSQHYGPSAFNDSDLNLPPSPLAPAAETSVRVCVNCKARLDQDSKATPHS